MSEGNDEEPDNFADFYGSLKTAKQEHFSSDPSTLVREPEEFEAQRQHLLNLYRDIEVQSSFIDSSIVLDSPSYRHKFQSVERHFG